MYGYGRADRFVYTAVEDRLPSRGELDHMGDFDRLNGDATDLRRIDAVKCPAGTQTTTAAGDSNPQTPAILSAIFPPSAWQRCSTRIAHLGALFWCYAGISQLLLVGGCVPIPITQTVRGLNMPVAEARIPADLRRSQTNVLLLMQTSRRAGESNVTNRLDAKLVAGDHLTDYLRSIATSSKFELFIAGCGGYTCAAVPIAQRQSSLERLCAIAQDGRTITLFSTDAPYEPTQTTIFEVRRNALLLALREDTNTPFVSVDGPCGVSGEVGVKETREIIIEFLSKIPRRRPAEEDGALAEVLGRGKIGGHDPAVVPGGGGVLFVLTSLHGQRAAEAPMYFSDADFKLLKDTLISRDATQIIPLLPYNASGLHAPEHRSLWLLCVVSSDGEVLWWKRGRGSWSRPGERPYREEWEAMTSAILDGLPSIHKQWASVFLNRTSVPVRAASDEAQELLAGSSQEEGAKQLLLGVTFRASGVLVTPVFLKSEVFSDALWSTSPVSSGEWARKVFGITSGGAPLDYVCVVSDEGQLIELEQRGDVPVDRIWRDAKPSRITDAWRQEAISALIRDGRYQGQFVCWLQNTYNWSDELRGKVAAFLRRTGSGAPATGK